MFIIAQGAACGKSLCCKASDKKEKTSKAINSNNLQTNTGTLSSSEDGASMV